MGENKIKKLDLGLITMDILDLKFNKGGYEVLTEYLLKKLEDDGVKIKVSEFKRSVILKGRKIDFSDTRKEEGIKKIALKLIKDCEDRGLDKNSPIGLWINNVIEGLSGSIVNDICEKIGDLIKKKRGSLYSIHSHQLNDEAKEKQYIEFDKAEDLFKRIEKSLKKIKLNTLIEVNTYVK